MTECDREQWSETMDGAPTPCYRITEKELRYYQAMTYREMMSLFRSIIQLLLQLEIMALLIQIGNL